MKLSRRSTSVPDRTSSRLPRLLTLVLVVGMLAFGVFYYQDQHVDAGPSMVDRQIQAAEAGREEGAEQHRARLQLAAAYRADKRLDDALKQYDEILKADKENRTALLGRGGVLIAKGDLTAAAASYHKITDVAAKGEFAGADPQLEEAHYFLGSIALKQGKTKEAITELKAALKIDRSDSDALYLLGSPGSRTVSPQARRRRSQTSPPVRADRMVRALLPARRGLRKARPARPRRRMPGRWRTSVTRSQPMRSASSRR